MFGHYPKIAELQADRHGERWNACQHLIDLVSPHPGNSPLPIKASKFGAVRLTAEHARRFLRHTKEDRPNPAARATLARGRQLLRTISERGKASLSSSRRAPALIGPDKLNSTEPSSLRTLDTAALF